MSSPHTCLCGIGLKQQLAKFHNCPIETMQTMQTVHRLHLSDQRQDHCVVNARSNRNVFSWRLNALWSVKSWSSVGNAYQALGPACEKHRWPNLHFQVTKVVRQVIHFLSLPFSLPTFSSLFFPFPPFPLLSLPLEVGPLKSS